MNAAQSDYVRLICNTANDPAFRSVSKELNISEWKKRSKYVFLIHCVPQFNIEKEYRNGIKLKHLHQEN